MALSKQQMWNEYMTRFNKIQQMVLDPNVPAKDVFVELCCSIYGGDEWNEVRYQYDDEGSSCFFMVDGIRFDVYDLRSMRSCSRVNKETYTDVCVLNCDYIENNAMLYHIIPDAWLYGSTCDGFDESKPVHDCFIEAAKEFIQKHHVTPEMQKME